MADSSSEHLIRIIVQGVNRLGDVVDRGTKAVEKHTAAVKKQSKAVEEGARTADDARRDFERLAKEIGDGKKDYDSATFALKRLSDEFDRLAKKEDVGSKTSDDLHRSALAAKALSEQLRVAHEIERKINEQDAKDRVRREEERQRLTAETLKKEVEAERKASEHRRSLVGDLLDEVRRDQDERAKLDKALGDAEVSERVRVEGERQRVVAEAARAEQAAQEQAARNRRSFLDDILDEVRRDHDEQLRLARELDAQDARDHQARLKRRVDEAVEHAQAVTQRSSTTLGRRIAIDPSPRRSLFQQVRAVISGDDSSGPRGFASEVDRVGRSSRTADSGLSRLERTIDRLSGSSDKAGFSIAKVDNNLRGLVVVGVIAFSQQLVSAMIALAGAALAVASAAAQAGLAVGGAFAAAAGQALPTIGLLVAAFGRIGAVFDAVKLFNTQATKSGFDQAQAADAQAAAADRVVSSNEQVVSASQRVKDATDALTEAREKARRKIEDLNLAERNASISQFDAERAISKAVASGDVGALEGLRNRRDEAVLGAGRATSAASDARAAGEDRAPEVLAAVRSVNEANAALRRARREADAAGRAATRALRTGSAADRALEQALAQLTPAELVLYESAKRIQKRFRTLFRPITDIIVTAFAGGVDGASKALGDTRVLGTALRLARSIATAISRIGKELTGNRSLNFFKTMGDEAAKNIPLLTTLFIRVNRIMGALSVAGGPALRKFIEFFVDLAGKGEEATNSKSGLAKLERFFLRGETMAESFLKLGGAIIQLFAALSGAGGAQTGLDLVDELTVSIQNATRWVKAHQDQVTAFFDDVARSTRAIGGAIVAISSAALDLFSSDKVIAFADAFERVLLPALVSTATALGEITFLLTKFISLPGISTIASLALSVGLLFKAFSIFGRLLIPFGAGLARVLGPMRVIGPLAIRLGMAMRVAAVLFAGPWGVAIAAVITGIVVLDKKFHFIRPSIRFIGELFSTAGRIVVDFAGHLRFLIPILNAVGKAITLAFKLTPFGFIAGLAGRFLGFVHSLDASKRALDSVSKAEDKLAESQRKSAAAQRDLTDARRSARRELNDLESNVRSGKLEVRQARFGVRDAKTDLTSLRSRGAPKTEIDDAELRLDQARENLRQTTRSAARSEEDYRAAKIKSASADGEIAKASAKAREARKKESDSVRDLDRASRDALKSKDSFVSAVSKLGFEGGLAGGLGLELRALNTEFDRTPSKIERIRSQVDKLKTRLSHLKDGSEEYRSVAEKLRSKQRALNDAMGDADEKGKKGAKGPRAIGRSAANAAGVVDEAFAAMVKGANKIGGQLGGIKALEYKATFDKGLAGAIAGAVEDKATGGWINRKGGPQGPDNRLIRAGDGEAVLAVPHQPIVDRALGFASKFMGGPSNLDEMFGRVKGYVGAFAKGGRIGGGLPNVLGSKPGFAVFMQMFQRLFGRDLFVMSGSRPGSLVAGSGRLSNHSAGNAIDISNPASAGGSPSNPPPKTGLDRLYPFIRKNLPFLDLLWRTTTGGNHFNHVHWGAPPAITESIEAARRFLAKIPEAAAAGLGGGSLKTPKISGPKGGLLDIVRALVKRTSRAANRKLDSTLGSVSSGTGDPGESISGDIIKIARHAAFVNRVKWDEAIVRVLLQKESGGGKNLGPSGPLGASGPFQVIGCVPLDTEVLTRRGWKTHDDVNVGDLTIGFNPSTGQSEWTRINRVVRYEDADLIRIRHQNFSARVTPEHRWWSEKEQSIPVEEMLDCPECSMTFSSTSCTSVHLTKIHSTKPRSVQPYHYVGQFVRSEDIGKRDRIRTSGPAKTGAEALITNDEAELIGWILGDGHIRTGKKKDGKAFGISIYQSKPRHLVVLKKLMEKFPHGESVRKRSENHLPAHTFLLRNHYARDLLERSRLLELGPEAFVLSLSHGQIVRFLDGITWAEGNVTDGYTRISQADGPTQDAIIMAVYLSGSRPVIGSVLNPKRPEHYKSVRHIGVSKPFVSGSYIRQESLGREDVWCVETGLGTWTMRQDRQVLLTGNSTFAANALPGHKDIRSVYDNALAAFHYIKGRYGSLENLAARTGLLGGSYKGYELGGGVPGKGPKPALLHGGEHVWTAMEVLRAGGHKVMYALRKMLGGGGQGGQEGYADGGKTTATKTLGYATPAVFDTSLDGVLRELARARKAIGSLKTRATKFAVDFGRSIGLVTDDGGLLDQASSALDRLIAGAARRLKKLAFTVNRSGNVVRRVTAQQEADAALEGIDKQISGLRGISTAANKSLKDVDRRLKIIRDRGVSGGERKAYETLVAARRSLVARIESIDGQVADAIESRFQAQEQRLQVAIDDVTSTAGRGLARADLADRTASLIEGVVGGASGAGALRGRTLQGRGNILAQQRDSLLPLLLQARAQGSTSIANDLIAQIEDLNVSIAENNAAIVQNTVATRQSAIESIARTAQRAATRADLVDRVASVVEATGNSAGAFSLRGQALLTRRGAIAGQRDALIGQLADAQTSFAGTTIEQQQIDDLIDQISDLNVQLDENVQALDHNTVAARQASIDAITGRGGFLGGTFGGLTNIVKGLGAISGREDVGRLRDIAQAAALVLGQTGAGLSQQLLEGFGIDLRGLDPSRLVDTIRTLNLDAIESPFSVEQRQQFEGLIAAIVDNASAVVDNTQQLAEMNSSRMQSFSTTAWQLFREAIFNGSGGLLPQYRLPMSSMSSISATSLSSGSVGGSSGGSFSTIGDSTVVVQVTNPTETTDPNWIGEVLAVKKPLARAT